MKVFHLAYRYGRSNTGGAMVAASRLHLALLDRGIESHFVCVWQNEAGPNVHVLPGGPIQRFLFFSLTKVFRCIWRLTPWRRSIPLNVVPLWGLEKLLAQHAPDIVHVHWIYCDTCSLKQLERLPYRIVFHLHDLYMLNGLELHPGADTRFSEGFSRYNSRFPEWWIYRRKAALVARKATAFVGPSRWVAARCRESRIGCDVPVHVVSNLVSPVFFQTWRNWQEKDNEGRFVLLFGAWGGRSNHFKGFADVVRALELLPESVRSRCELRVFGESAEDCETSGVPTHFLGEIESESRLVEIYRSSHLLLFPSLIETQGLSKVEALLCGLPVIAFDRAACAEGIVHGENGWIARDGDVRAFAEGIVFFFELHRSRRLPDLSGRIAAQAEAAFAPEKILSGLLDAYAKR